MLQECHKKYWESDRTDLIESVKRLLRRKKKESEQRGDTAIYIHLLFRLLSAETAREVLEAIVEIMPQAVVTGMTETIFVNEDMESMLRMNFTFFSHGSVKLMEYLGPSECYEEAGKTIAEKISRMPQVKAVGIYSAGPSTDFHKFVSCVSGANEEIPFFGATAGTFEFSADDRNRFRNLFFLDKYSDAEQYVVGTKVYYQGILLVLFSLTMAEVFLVLAAYSVNAAYSEIGAQRELLQMMAYEPMTLLTAVGFYLSTGSFKVEDIIRTDIPLIIKMPGFFIGFFFII